MKIKLNKIWYSKEGILEALHAYSKVGKGTIVDDEFTIEFTPKENNIPHIKEEFTNYVLACMQNKK